MNATEKARLLGARITNGINWSWAKFTTEAPAREFEQWCSEHDYETRGVYAPYNDEFWGVRYR